MRCKSKGQAFNLEVILMLLVATLTIGYTVNSLALQQQRAVEDLEFASLEQAGKRAAAVLEGGVEWQCVLLNGKMVDAGFFSTALEGHAMLPGTLDKQLRNSVTKERLGIPAGYGCEIKVLNSTNPALFAANDLVTTDCATAPPAGAKRVFSVYKRLSICDSSSADHNLPTKRLKTGSPAVDKMLVSITIHKS